MLVDAQVSSMKTSRSGSRSSWPSNQASRRFSDVRAVLLGWRAVFLNVMPWRSKKRHRACACYNATLGELSAKLQQCDVRLLFNAGFEPIGLGIQR